MKNTVLLLMILFCCGLSQRVSAEEESGSGGHVLHMGAERFWKGERRFEFTAPSFNDGTLPVKNLCTARIIRSDLLATAEQRKAALPRISPIASIANINKIIPGIGFYWSDTPVGVARDKDGGYLFFGAAGALINANTPLERDATFTRIKTNSLDNPLGSGPILNIMPWTPNLPTFIDYVGSGPVLRIHPSEGNPLRNTDYLLMIYHAERATFNSPWTYPAGYPANANGGGWSYLGLAASGNDGLSWVDLGIVIAGNQPYLPNYDGFYDIGNSSLVFDPTGQYLYVYFRDWIADGTPIWNTSYLSAARAPAAELVDFAIKAVNSDYGTESNKHETEDKTQYASSPFYNPVTNPYYKYNWASNRGGFYKYYKGQWNEPGLGGKASNLFGQSVIVDSSNPGDPGDSNIAWNDYLRRYIATFSNGHKVFYSESPDGIHWSIPNDQTVLIDYDPPSNPGGLNIVQYPSLVGLGDDPTRLGQTFYLYFMQSVFQGGFSTDNLRRLTIECEPSHQKP